MSDFELLVDCINQHEDFVVVSHVNPDGDSVGSMVAMGLILKNLNKNVELINQDEVPDKYKFLTKYHPIKRSQDWNPDASIAIFVDCTDISRAGESIIKQIDNRGKQIKLINIDHHISNNSFGEYNLVDADAAATGEIIFKLVDRFQQKLNSEIATSIYTALMSDTGSFRYSNTTSNTLAIASKLRANGADIDLINEQLYETTELQNLHFLSAALAKIELSVDGKVGWIKLPYNLLKEYDALENGTEGLVNFPKSIKGVEVGILFTEANPNEVKVSFRSKGNVDVNLLASKFGGGGHKRAAGCKFNDSELNKCVNEVLGQTKKIISQDEI